MSRTSGGPGAAGVVGVVCTLLLVVTVIGGLVLAVRDRAPERVTVPDTVPPAAAAPVDPDDAAAVADTASALKIPERFLRAYLVAARTAATEHPDCHLRWNTLAGLGWSESHHGTYGVVDGEIVGPRLDGSAGFMEIPDTDRGRLDGDRRYDRAVGPLQFLPGSWEIYGAGGDPQDIDDAAPAAGRLLCAGGRDLDDPADWSEAVFAYNHSDEYLAGVRDAAANYAVGQSAT